MESADQIRYGFTEGFTDLQNKFMISCESDMILVS